MAYFLKKIEKVLSFKQCMSLRTVFAVFAFSSHKNCKLECMHDCTSSCTIPLISENQIGIAINKTSHYSPRKE